MDAILACTTSNMCFSDHHSDERFEKVFPSGQDQDILTFSCNKKRFNKNKNNFYSKNNTKQLPARSWCY